MKVKALVPLYKHQHDYVMSKHARPAIIAGYGAGKTFANVYRTLMLLELRNGKAFIFYAAPTYDLIYSTYYILLLETLDMFNIKYHEVAKHHLIVIDTPELAGVIKLISLDKYKNLVGFTATDGILDEFDVIALQRQKEIWTRALARLRGAKDGTLSITSTPEGHKYCYSLFKRGIINQITASTTDNKSLPESFVADMMESFDQAHIDMYINGLYANLNGLRAMYNYKEQELIEPLSVGYELPTAITVGMDFNVNPFCATVSMMQYDGDKWVKITFDEFFIRNTAGCDGYASFTDKTMMLILQRYPNLWYKTHIDPTVSKIYDITVRPDMTGGNRDTAAKLTDLVIISKYGVKIEGTRNPPVSSRITIANIALQKGLWKVTKKCVNLIADMEMCVTDEHGELAKGTGVDGDRTHMLDAATYDTFQEFKELLFVKPKSEAGGL